MTDDPRDILTLEEVRRLDRMAHHDAVDGAEFWWGPNGGVRVLFADFPEKPHPLLGNRFQSHDVVVRAFPETNAIHFPVIDATPLGEPGLPPELSFSQWTLHVPRDGWHHLPGCDCEFCLHS